MKTPYWATAVSELIYSSFTSLTTVSIFLSYGLPYPPPPGVSKRTAFPLDNEISTIFDANGGVLISSSYSYENLLISAAKNEHEEVFIYLLDNYEDDKLTINLETNSTECKNILRYYNSYCQEKNITIEIKKNRKRNRDVSNINPFVCPTQFELNKKKRIE